MEKDGAKVAEKKGGVGEEKKEKKNELLFCK